MEFVGRRVVDVGQRANVLTRFFDRSSQCVPYREDLCQRVVKEVFSLALWQCAFSLVVLVYRRFLDCLVMDGIDVCPAGEVRNQVDQGQMIVPCRLANGEDRRSWEECVNRCPGTYGAFLVCTSILSKEVCGFR